MKVLVAMDSFKGTFSSYEVAGFVEKGIRRVYESAIIDKVAIADGGEGTVTAIVEALQGEYIPKEVTGPLGNKVMANYGIVDGNTAVMEMAEASGLHLISPEQRNPLLTSTFGTGELINAAIAKGCSRIIIGIGGSATNDGGVGMAKALGIRFLDKNGREIGLGGGELGKLAKIDLSRINARIKETEIMVACDVVNPLCGVQGASRVFGPQKGATPEVVEQLEKNLLHYAEILKRDLGLDVKDIPGAGAAGGLGAGLIAFCKAGMMKGIDIVLDTIRIDERIQNADLVITGEGRIDGQTIFGKTPVGIALRAKKYQKPVFAVAGFIGQGAEQVYDYGIDAMISSIVSPTSLEDTIANSPRLIEEATERLFRIIKVAKNYKL